MIIAGYDPGLTKPALVIIDETGKILFKRVYKNNLRGIERLIWLRDEISRDLFHYDVDHIGMEAPTYGAVGSEHARGQIDGIMEVVFHENEIPYNLIHPTQVKKFILGTGRGDKNLILLKTFQEYGEEFQDDNEADAYILARIMEAVLNIDRTSLKLKKPQREVVEAILKGVSNEKKR